jgi:hypothetical protein
VVLSDDQMRRLDEVSAYPPIFPNNFFQKDFVPKYVYGGLKDQID